jgi:hypothetical protein
MVQCSDEQHVPLYELYVKCGFAQKCWKEISLYISRDLSLHTHNGYSSTDYLQSGLASHLWTRNKISNVVCLWKENCTEQGFG